MNYKKTKKGIDTKRLLNTEDYSDINDIIKCKICFEIILNPIDCLCQHTFCYNCLNFLKENNHSCPFQCNLAELDIDKGNSSRGIKSILSLLKFKCKNTECEEDIAYADIIGHDSKCVYNPLICPNLNCKRLFKACEIETHAKQLCEFRLVECEKCLESIPSRYLDSHGKLCDSIYDTLNNKSDMENSIFCNTLLHHLKNVNIDSIRKMDVITSEVNKLTKNFESKFNLIEKSLNEIVESNFQTIDQKLELINQDIKKKQGDSDIDEYDCIIRSLESMEKNLKEKIENEKTDYYKKIEDIKEKVTNLITIEQAQNNIQLFSLEIEKKFELVWCERCKKVDNEINFKNCYICSKKFCRECCLCCKSCSCIYCDECVDCEGCHDRICIKCRKTCISCSSENKLFCENCLTECKNCKSVNCYGCLKTCSQCNLAICNNLNCSNTCKFCNKSLCKKCQIMTENNFIPCTNCKILYSCQNCIISCISCRNFSCKNCINKCKKCKKSLCKYHSCSKNCESCGESYCADSCAKSVFNTKCHKCEKYFCNYCVSSITVKCSNCKEINCKTCISSCSKCKMSLCTKCNVECKQCGSSLCKGCTIKCQCGQVDFCENCKNDIIPIAPHDCNFWLNKSPVFNGLKTRSEIALPTNFEAKVFIEKMKGESVSIGITDNNTFDNNSIIFVDRIWTLRLKTGQKYSSNCSLEPYLKKGAKEFDIIYIICNNRNLVFKINNEVMTTAYTLEGDKTYYLYVENEEARKECKLSLIYILKI